MATVDVSSQNGSGTRVLLIHRFSMLFGIACVLVSSIPFFFGLITTPPNHFYIGHQLNVDDHMVYAAWMRQAMDGRLLFDNRFTTDVQPGLTIHVYFLTMGWLAKVVGLVWAPFLAKCGFTYLFVWLLSRLLLKTNLTIFQIKLGLFLAIFASGLGFLQWQPTGREFIDKGGILSLLSGGWIPIDVWQPEAFVFPSMLTNSLFMVSLCLILGVLGCILAAKDSWKPVLPGAVMMLILMNIHSYDVLLITLVSVCFGVSRIFVGTFNLPWAMRALVIGAGAIPAALWFLHVLQIDQVFQARAATETFSPTFKQVILGVLPAVVIAIIGLFQVDDTGRDHRKVGVAVASTLAILFVASTGADPGRYWLTLPLWLLVYGIMIALASLQKQEDDFVALLWSWALVATIAIYFPALFQRKLGIGLMIPWGLLAAISAGQLLKGTERSSRNLVTSLCLFLACATSVFWIQRELLQMKENLSITLRHKIFYPQDVRAIIDLLNAIPGRKVVAAIPDLKNAETGALLIPDLNPVLSGFTGAYTYAGHWSETPEYAKRMAAEYALFSARTSADKRLAILRLIHPDFLVAPSYSTFGEAGVADMTKYGKTVFTGNQYTLIKVDPDLLSE